MFGQQNKPDKVNMSLDDIIKMNKKQGKQTKPNQNAAQKSNRQFNNKNNNRNNQRVNNNAVNKNSQQPQRRKQQGKFQNQPVNKKSFGMLNRSRSIKKNHNQNKNNVVFTPKQNKNQPKPARFQQNRRPVQAQFVGNRRRPMQKNNQNQVKKNGATLPRNAFNRFGTNQNVKKQIPVAASKITIIKPAPMTTPKKTNIIKRPTQQKFGQNQRQRQQKRQAAGTIVKSKIAMQSARKNVQKAKRLLVARKQPVKQLMTKHYASKIGLTSKLGLTKPRVKTARPIQRPLQQPRKNKVALKEKPKMLSISFANKAGKVQKSKAIHKPAQIIKKAVVKHQIKKPILNRTRPQGLAGTTSTRMVFY